MVEGAFILVFVVLMVVGIVWGLRHGPNGRPPFAA